MITVPTLRIIESVALLELGDGENRMTRDAIDEINAMLDDVLSLREPLALLTIGQGKFFCNGLPSASAAEDVESRTELRRRWAALLHRLLTFPAPTVAALNGHAFGAGALLALAHDHRLMRSDRGFFCLPEVELGRPFSPGVTALVKSKLPPRAITTVMLTARRLGGEEARHLGVVDELAANDVLLERALGFAGELAGPDYAVLGAVKKELYSGVTESLGRDSAAATDRGPAE